MTKSPLHGWKPQRHPEYKFNGKLFIRYDIYPNIFKAKSDASVMRKKGYYVHIKGSPAMGWGLYRRHKA